MKKGKTAALWTLTIFFALSALVFFPSFFSLFAILLVLLVIPIPKWQNILVNFIRGKLKGFIAIVLALLSIFTVPTTNTDTTPHTAPAEAAAYTSALNSPTTIPITTPASYTTTPPIIEEAIAATTPTIEDVTTATPATEDTTAPTTEPPHTHNFSSATCTDPKICSCGVTEGNAIGHKFTNGKCTACKIADPNYNYETMVWIPTKGGKKYHTHAGCSNMEDPEQVTKSQAEALGFTPCKRCH